MSETFTPTTTTVVILYWMFTVIAGGLLIRMIFLTRDHVEFFATSVIYLLVTMIKLSCVAVLYSVNQPVVQPLITDILGLIFYLLLLVLMFMRTRV